MSKCQHFLFFDEFMKSLINSIRLLLLLLLVDVVVNRGSRRRRHHCR